MSNKDTASNVSIIIPAYEETDTVLPLCEQLKHVCDPLFAEYEIILIDDGSKDTTWESIENATNAIPQAQGIKLRRNFGKSHALDVGINAAKYDLLLTMDADLQDDPKEIPKLIEAYDEGYSMVVGWKQKRQDGLSKTLPSKIFNKATSLISGLKLHDYNSGFKLFDRNIMKDQKLYGELHRYIPLFAHHLGYEVTEVPVNHHPRKFGKSKFGIERYLRGLIDLITVMTITRYSMRPGHLFGTIGALFFLIGFMPLCYLTGVWMFTDNPIGDRPLLLFGVLFVGISFQFMFFGMLSELLLSKLNTPSNQMTILDTT